MLALPDGASLPELAPTILAVLVDLILKGMLLLALAGLITFLFRRGSAALRHLVWSLALGSLLLLPVFTLALPAWHVTALTEIPYLHTVAEALETVPATHEAVAMTEVTVPEATSITAQEASAPVEQGIPRAPAMPEPAHKVVLQAFSNLVHQAQGLHWTVWLTMLWVLGMLAILGRFIIGALGVYWFAFRARSLNDPAWHAQARAVREQLGLRRRVRLLRSTRTAMPMTWGVLRPIVLLPVNADAWTSSRRHCVLLHEFAHIQRLDCLTQTLAQLVCAIHWFNPLVWVAARQMREEREKACDDWVLEGGIRPSHYAAHLLDIARSTRSTLVMPLGTLSMARPSQLEGRVIAILDKARSRGPLSRFGTGVSILLASLLVLPLAALQAGDPEPGEVQEASVTPVIWKPVQKHAFRWTGSIGKGQTLILRGGQGDIQTTLTAGRTVEVVAMLDEQTPVSSLGVTVTGDGVILCVQHDDAGCKADAAPSPHTRVTFIARVPAGVHVDARTSQGAIKAVGLRSNVTAATTAGDIFVQTTGEARAKAERGNIELRTGAFGMASTEQGNILARLGQTTWRGTLPLHAQKGDITVELPAAADTDIDLRVESQGRLQATIPLEQQAERGEQFRGRLGRGGRMLALHTATGNITVTHLGPSDVEVEQAFDIRLESELAYDAGHDGSYRFASLDLNDRRRLVSRLAREGDANTLAMLLRQDPSPRVRTRAAHALGVIQCSDGLPALIAGLDDEDSTVRRAAVQALAQYDDPRVEKVLVSHLRGEENAAVRSTVAEAVKARAEPTRSGNAVAARTERTPVQDRPIVIDLNRLEENIHAIDEDVAAELSRVVRLWADKLDLHLDLELDSNTWERLLRDVTRRSRYMRDLKRAGYKNVVPEEALLARLVGVDARYVREVQEAGLCGSLEEMVQLKLAGVSIGFIKALKADGREDLSVSEVLSLRRASARGDRSWSGHSNQVPVDGEREGFGFELR